MYSVKPITAMCNLVAICILSIFALSATAKETKVNLRSGLWQVTTNSDLLLLAQHIPQAQLDSISEIAKTYGLDMPQINNGAAISQTCITPTMAKQQTIPQLYQPELGCITKSSSRRGNHYQASFSCHGKQLKGQGTIKGKMTSPTHFVGSSQFKGTAQGVPVDETATFNGQWQQTSCPKSTVQ